MMHVIVVGVESNQLNSNCHSPIDADISRCARVFVAGIERWSQSALASVKCLQNKNIDRAYKLTIRGE